MKSAHASADCLRPQPFPLEPETALCESSIAHDEPHNLEADMNEGSAPPAVSQIKLAQMLKNVFNSLVKTTNATLRPKGLTLVQSLPLKMLHEQGSTSVTVLADNLGLTLSAMSRVLDRLDEMGLCSRTRSEVDRRQVSVEITDQGRLLAEGLEEALAQSEEAHLAGFTLEELTDLKAMLRRMLRNGARYAALQDNRYG